MNAFSDSEKDGKKKVILDFLKNHPLGVIATFDQSKNTPEAALVAFAETDALELVFETFVDSRKYANLKHNPHVAFVVGWDADTHITLQYEGIAVEARDEKEIKSYAEILLNKKTPCTETFLSNPKVRMFKVTPTWIGLSDYTGDVPFVIEIKIA